VSPSLTLFSLYSYHLAFTKNSPKFTALNPASSQSSASHGLSPPPATLCTTLTRTELTKNPNDSVLKKSPVLIVFIPPGHSLRKKSSCPMYVSASPDPTSTNCGTSQKTLSWARRCLRTSVSAAAAMARTERTSPVPMRWRGKLPEDGDEGAVVNCHGEENGGDEEDGEGGGGDLEGGAHAAVHGDGLGDGEGGHLGVDRPEEDRGGPRREHADHELYFLHVG
ncbi:phenylalanine--tRNA ligase beta subunit, partial [Striga asiatica]